MIMPSRGRVAAASLIWIGLLSGSDATGQSRDDFAQVTKAYLSLSHPTDWDGVEALPGITWAPLPSTELQNCLPGGCYARAGTATIAGRRMNVVAVGARTMVLQIYFRNPSTPLGEEAVLAALARAGLSTDLARCPVRGGPGATKWYRITGGGVAPGVLAIQPPRTGARTEGLILTHGEDLPALQPQQVALYSEQCAPGVEQTPVSTLLPHERLAQVVVTLLAPVGAAGLYDWNGLIKLPTDITWTSAEPKQADLSAWNDPNPLMLSGSTTMADRKFSVMASGTPGQVQIVRLEETGLHPRGEHMLGVVYEKGFAVKLVRCGPVYTESTNNWYSVTGRQTRPAMIRQSIRYDGNQVQDSYELRLDGSLPPRDPRDRDPGVNGC